jgi:hypothetical protein
MNNKISMNCWEFMKCERQSDGKKSDKPGICPASTDTTSNGINGGKNAGRYCWRVAGKYCYGKIQGMIASKVTGCFECKFFKKVNEEEGNNYRFMI